MKIRDRRKQICEVCRKTSVLSVSLPWMKWKHSLMIFQYHTYLGFLDLIYLYPSPGLLALLMATPSLHSWNRFVLLHTFPYTINDYVIHNSKIPGYQSHHTRNVIIHPQKNCSVHFSTKNKENLLLPKVYESKRVQIGIGTLQINFSCWKKTYQLIWLSSYSNSNSVSDRYAYLQKSICISSLIAVNYL